MRPQVDLAAAAVILAAEEEALSLPLEVSL